MGNNKIACVKWVLVFAVCVAAAGAAAQETEKPASEVRAYEAQTPEDEPSAAPGIWWGNRSVSYGNYMRFERMECQGICKYCTKDMICCETGCPCESCQYICDDCDNCPPMVFDKIFFDLDSARLRPEGEAECVRIAEYLHEHVQFDVIIEGHTCDLASDQYNINLGRRRAESVKQCLLEQGVNSSRITTRSYGEEQPWMETGQRELNRRAIVIVVTPGAA